MGAIRVVVVDDHDIVRVGLAGILGREKDIHLLATAEDGEEGLRLIRELNPDVAVVDYQLPGMSGTELCEVIVKEHPEIPVVILTTWLDDHVIQSSLEAGARAYVYKDVDGTELVKTIRTVAKGDAVLDPKIVGRVMKWASESRGLVPETLSSQEKKIIRLVAKGVITAEIADQLGISVGTVKNYLHRAMRKLNCRSRAEVAAFAAKRGML